MMHPTIEHATQTGYQYMEPQVFDNCVCCGDEIHDGDEYTEHAGNAFCSGECLLEIMYGEGNANLAVAGQ